VIPDQVRDKLRRAETGNFNRDRYNLFCLIVSVNSYTDDPLGDGCNADDTQTAEVSDSVQGKGFRWQISR